MSVTIPLRCGTLTLDVEQADIPLSELCAFGTRRNRKRGFLFISKVLGKHIPVRPGRMLDIHERLARRLADIEGPAVLIAMAETATGLGQGVFEALLRQTGRDDILFLHTTRYRLQRPLALAFEESHSHAPEHLLYQPAEPENVQLFRDARTLILVDDEISTGRTLTNLAREYRRFNPRLRRVIFGCITDWMGQERRRQLAAEIEADVAIVHLLCGNYHFVANPDFDPGPVPTVTGRGEPKDAILPWTGGRFGLRRCHDLDTAALLTDAGLKSGERVLVLGTGEFAYPPIRLALHLEQTGWDVHYQSTTRSPILVGEAIASAVEFIDNYGDEMPNYVYNVADRQYDRILIGHETHPLPLSYRLPELLGAGAVCLEMRKQLHPTSSGMGR
jgi:hypothetical protein